MTEVRLIDANALFNDLKESAKAAREWKEEAQDEEIKIRADQAHGTFIECALRVKNAPTIEAEPVRHGRWIAVPAAHDTRIAKCSLCGFWQKSKGNDKTGGYMIHKVVYRYCSACGARMDGGEQE